MRLGTRVLISREAAEQWRREREQDTVAPVSKAAAVSAP
jgi:hypothetical protein